MLLLSIDDFDPRLLEEVLYEYLAPVLLRDDAVAELADVRLHSREHNVLF